MRDRTPLVGFLPPPVDNGLLVRVGLGFPRISETLSRVFVVLPADQVLRGAFANNRLDFVLLCTIEFSVWMQLQRPPWSYVMYM